QRDGFVELELRPAVERGEVLSGEREVDRHHRAFRHRHAIAVVRNSVDLRVPEDRRIELRGVFGLRVEPEERRDLLHGVHFTSGRSLCSSLGGCIAYRARPIACSSTPASLSRMRRLSFHTLLSSASAISTLRRSSRRAREARTDTTSLIRRRSIRSSDRKTTSPGCTTTFSGTRSDCCSTSSPTTWRRATRTRGG